METINRHSTALVGPYDHLSSIDKTSVSCLIPHDIKRSLFVEFLPFRGAVDKLLSRSIYMFDGYISLHPNLRSLDADVRERVANNILNSITDHLVSLDPNNLLEIELLKPNDNTTTDSTTAQSSVSSASQPSLTGPDTDEPRPTRSLFDPASSTPGIPSNNPG